MKELHELFEGDVDLDDMDFINRNYCQEDLYKGEFTEEDWLDEYFQIVEEEDV